MTTPAGLSTVEQLARQSPPVRLPALEDGGDVSQDEEWFEVRLGGDWQKLRLHEYGAIFSVQGLYERIVYDLLDCRSPQVVRRLLEDQLVDAEVDSKDLWVLDFGAGNGCVAEELSTLPVGGIVGLDIAPEAEAAAERDRPGLYDDYVVGDICHLSPRAEQKLSSQSFTCLISVAALGFGDIPPLAFAQAFNQIDRGGWVAFTLKESFLEDEDETGFAALIRRMIDRRTLEIKVREAYRHRIATARSPLTYVAFIGRKLRDVDR